MADLKSPNTLSMPGTKPAQESASEVERKVEVILLHDVWIDDPDHEESIGGVRRIKTNIPRLREDGGPMIDPKTKALVTDTVKVALPVSLAKKLISAGKAERADPL